MPKADYHRLFQEDPSENIHPPEEEPMKKPAVLLACVAIVGIGAYLYPGQAKHHLIIDTDCGFDDLRAIVALLADHECEVEAITTSEGSLSAVEGLGKVRSLLKALHHEGIPTAAGRSLGIQPPPWRGFCLSIPWGEEGPSPSGDSPSAVDLIASLLQTEPEGTCLVCLGGLTTASDLSAKLPEMKSRIDRVVWYNEAAEASKGFNGRVDQGAAERILGSGLKVDVVKAWDQDPQGYDSAFLGKLSGFKTPSAGLLAASLGSEAVRGDGHAAHMILRDDLVPLYILDPSIFRSERNGDVSLNSLRDGSAAKSSLEMMLEILSGQKDTESQVFARFPDDPALFAPDIRPYVPAIIEKHGRSEWRAGVITDELHGHLGIYAIVGVKMGIRAREYFGLGVDDLKVLSFAGRKPPVSCFNDGLQAGTGGTLGHGLITVSDEPRTRAEAVFSFKGRKIRISLKKEAAERVEAAISKAIDLYGNLTLPYWEDVRREAIRFWLELDRHEIFVIQEIK
jgi:pyrimidine-specific ribonucleoside hydrolase